MHNIEVTLSQTKLTEAEADGSLARKLGMVPKRKRQVGRRFLQQRFTNPKSVLCVYPL